MREGERGREKRRKERESEKRERAVLTGVLERVDLHVQQRE